VFNGVTKTIGNQFFANELRRIADRRFLAFIICVLFLASAGFAQVDDPVDPNDAPPPVKAMSKEERIMLDAKPELKDRTKLAVELMSARLTRAEAFNAKQEFTEMYGELGGFHALMDNTLDILVRGSHNNLNTIKRFEIALRAFTPRLALILRELPDEFDHYVRTLIRYLRDARSKVIEPLFGNSVVPNQRT